MAGRDSAKDALPSSHVFITIARGRSSRTFMTRSALAYAIAVLAPILGLWLAGSTLYLAFHDDLVAGLMLRQRDMQYDYEDRIASLKSQLDRDASHRLVSQRSVEAKLDELASREAELQTRSGIVARLAEQAGRLTGSASSHRTVLGQENAMPKLTFNAAAATDNPATPVSTQDPHDAIPAPKPRPEAAVMVPFGMDAPRPVGGEAAAPLPERLSALSNRLEAISVGQESRVADLDGEVRKAMSHIHDALAVAGLSEQRFTPQHEQASGGPFVPLTRNDASPFARATIGLQLTLSQAERLQASVARVPFDKPLQGDPEVTSPFGARVDPFLGRPAMHTGIDLAEDNGTEVRATAPGRITVAGTVSGYGTMVEIDHGAGLSTRYAHLSEAGVAVGQNVRLGDIIGRVGATGRATGPHLHYETRIDGEAVDPLRFLSAGQRLHQDSRSL